MVVAQGALGAITVQFKLPWFVSTGHLLLAMSYFAMLIYAAFRTRPAPSVLDSSSTTRCAASSAPPGRGSIACAAIFVQLLLGALVRHLGAV